MRPLVARAPLPAGVVEAARYMFALSNTPFEDNRFPIGTRARPARTKLPPPPLRTRRALAARRCAARGSSCFRAHTARTLLAPEARATRR